MSPFTNNEVIDPDHAKWLIIQKRDRHSGITSVDMLQVQQNIPEGHDAPFGTGVLHLFSSE